MKGWNNCSDVDAVVVPVPVDHDISGGFPAMIGCLCLMLMAASMDTS